MSELTLSGLLDTVWLHLVRGASDRRHPARHPTLATLGPDGPELRTLVLRGVDRALSRLELHTDTASPKYAQIAADPRVAVHVWLPKPRLQIRARAVASLAPGDPAVFQTLPPAAQANYGGPAPGDPLTQGADPGRGDPARFARILCDLTEIDALLLAEPHRRALFAAESGWSGAWIAP